VMGRFTLVTCITYVVLFFVRVVTDLAGMVPDGTPF
jgi:hypothetical protein